MDNAPLTSHWVHVHPAGLQFHVEGGATLLQAADKAGVQWPRSCRNGTCRACMCRLLSGTVVHTIDWPGLLPEEKTAGYVLPCVARPTSDIVVELSCAIEL